MATIINEQVVAMLKAIEAVLERFGIDFYMVGAVARDVQLGEFAHTRKTNDIDLAIRVGSEATYNRVKAALIETGNFDQHETEAIKLYYQHAIELDLLPFGDIEGENRDITLHEPRLFSINMPGFREAYPYADLVQFEEIGGLKICSLEGLVLLKLIAHDDRPERTKDIADIEHVLRHFFEINQDQVYEEHFDLMDLYDVNDVADYLALVGAHMVGRKIKIILAADLKLTERLKKILLKRPTKLWSAIHKGLSE